VIDAYLGAHHEVDLGAMDDSTAMRELGLSEGQLGVDQLEHLGGSELEAER
jgi:hypothetical protein